VVRLGSLPNAARRHVERGRGWRQVLGFKVLDSCRIVRVIHSYGRSFGGPLPEAGVPVLRLDASSHSVQHRFHTRLEQVFICTGSVQFMVVISPAGKLVCPISALVECVLQQPSCHPNKIMPL
jgi:hypothetical protein